MARRPTATQQAALQAFIDRWAPGIAQAFMDAVYRARARVDYAALIDALERQDMLALNQMLRMEARDFSAMQEAMRAAYMAGGETVTDFLPRVIVAEWGFDGQNQRAQSWIANRGAELVQGIQQDTQDAVQLALRDVMENHQTRSLRSAALDIIGRVDRVKSSPTYGKRVGGILGLTSQQTDWVINARNDLHNLDPRYFTRAKRDKRFDRTVKKAISEGKPLSQVDIDKITGRYKDRLLDHRGKIISEHETFTAQAESREEAMRQVLDRDDVEDVTRKWQLGFPNEHRPNHVALAGMRISFNERFDLGGGIFARCPHDPDLPASESLNCRCSCVYRVKLKRD